jgi:hypothetical protein
MTLSDLIWALVSFVLTVLVFSYLLGDNPFLRFASSVFVGAAAGYVVVVALDQVLWPKLFEPLIFGSISNEQRILLLVPLVLGILLLFKLFPRLTRLGNGSMAYLVGSGAAVIIGGALLGTLFPQSAATVSLFDLGAAESRGASPAGQLIEGLYVLAGVSATLVYFYFGARGKTEQEIQRPPWISVVSDVGGIFLAITLGALFAGVYVAALTALVERVQFLWNTILALFIR